jgi:hypothetical protein
LEIYIITKNVYGSDLFYVKGKVAAKVISQLTGRKTVTRLDIDNLGILGLKVRVSEEAQEALGWTAEEAGAKAVDKADMEAWMAWRVKRPLTLGVEEAQEIAKEVKKARKGKQRPHYGNVYSRNQRRS